MDTEPAKWQTPRCQRQLGLNNLCWYFEQKWCRAAMASWAVVALLVFWWRWLLQHPLCSKSCGVLLPRTVVSWAKGWNTSESGFPVVRMGFTIPGWSIPGNHHTHRNMVKVAKMGQPSCSCCHMNTDPFSSKRITEYSALEETHKDHWVQLLSEWPMKGSNLWPWCY